jgi:hypothetical protein
MVNTKISEKDALRFQLRNELIKQPIQRDELRKVFAVLDNPRQLTQTDIDRIIDKKNFFKLNYLFIIFLNKYFQFIRFVFYS